MKLSLKLAAVILAFCAFLLPFAKPPQANAQAGACQLIVSTTEVVAHGSFNVTVQNGQPGVEYVIKYVEDALSFNPTIFTIPASGSQSFSVNLDDIFGASNPFSSSGQFLVIAGTTTAMVPPAESCSPIAGILITVIAPPIPTVSITAASTNIPYNTGTTLTWTSTNADTCTLNGSGVATNDSQPTGNLTSTTLFTFTCTNISGSATATVTVNVAAPPPPICSPPTQTVTTGANANFTASAGTGTYTWSAPGGSPSSGSGASFATSYSTAGAKTVTLTSGSLTDTCAVTVTAPAPTADIKANGSNGPITIAYNTKATLTWSSTNSTTCLVNPGGYTGTSSSGQLTGNLTNPTYTYTLTCNGPGGSDSDSVVINVNPPTPCSYDFAPTTVDAGGSITVTIRSGDPTHTFFATIGSLPAPGSGTRNGLGNIILVAPNVASDTTYLVAARDDVTDTLCALTPGATNTLTVIAPLTWDLHQPIVASNQLSVLFSFSPDSNGNIGLVVTNTSTGLVAFDSGPITSGTFNITWNFPPPGNYSAVLIFGLGEVSNRRSFDVNPPAGNTWILTNINCSDYTVVFGISPNSGGDSVLHIIETGEEVTIGPGVPSVIWNAPHTPGNYSAVIIYWGTRVSNPVTNISLPCTPEATQWTLTFTVTNGNDVTFTVQCPTEDCPGYGGGPISAAVDITNTGTSLSAGSITVPASGGTLPPITLPNGSYHAQVNAGLEKVGGEADFTLPRKTDCGWLAFPGGAGIVFGPVNNCALASPGGIISAILPYVFGIAGFLSVIIIVISGIQFITSSGNPEAAASARNRLIFALIGLAVIILAFAILQIVDRLFLGGSGVS